MFDFQASAPSGNPRVNDLFACGRELQFPPAQEWKYVLSICRRFRDRRAYTAGFPHCPDSKHRNVSSSDHVARKTVRRKGIGIEAEPLLARTYVWTKAMAQYEVGHLDTVSAIEARLEALPGLGLAGRVAFRQADLLAGIPDGALHMVISNPPYIPSAEIEKLQPEVRDYEPRHALDGGKDGLQFYRQLSAESGSRLQLRGRIMVEFGDGQQQQGDRDQLQQQRPGLLDPAAVLHLGDFFGDVPDDDLAVVAARDQRFAVGRGGDRPDDRRLAFEAGDLRPGFDVPDFYVPRAVQQAFTAAGDELVGEYVDETSAIAQRAANETRLAASRRQRISGTGCAGRRVRRADRRRGSRHST